MQEKAGAASAAPAYCCGLIFSQLVQVVLHHAEADDAKAKQAQNQVQNGVVGVGNALGCAALGQLLFSQENTHEGHKQHQNDLQNAAVSRILNGYSFSCQHDDPVNAVNAAGDDGEQQNHAAGGVAGAL